MWHSLQDILTQQLWTYDPESSWHVLYHWFNVAEGSVWVWLGLVVAKRFLLFDRSLWEVAYAVAFLMFGVSDFIEAQSLYVWLIAWKALNLAILLLLRRYVLKHCYPDRRW